MRESQNPFHRSTAMICNANNFSSDSLHPYFLGLPRASHMAVDREMAHPTQAAQEPVLEITISASPIAQRGRLQAREDAASLAQHPSSP